jgi:zinc transport system substrate-binding protein
MSMPAIKQNPAYHPGQATNRSSCSLESRRSWQGLIGLILMACAVLMLLAGPAGASPGKLRVAASLTPLGDFCRQIGGELVEVQVLIPPGASPHVFEPSPSEVTRVMQAQVVVYVGAGLEPWMDKILRARGTASLTVVEATQGIPLIQGVEEHPGEKAHEEHAEHSHEGGNPHVWLDPVLAQKICRKIAAAFIQVDPAHRQAYEANLGRYLTALQELDQDIRQQVQTWRIHDFVSFHDAFGYFAQRYHLHLAGVIEAAPGREPSPRYLAELISTIRQRGIRVVFAEPQLNPRIAEVIAGEAGAKVLMLDPVGGRPPYGSNYLQLMRYNLAEMAQAMK